MSMRSSARVISFGCILLTVSCTRERDEAPVGSGSTASAMTSATAASAGIDSMNAKVERAYRSHDPVAYGALFTDSAQFEWAAVPTVRGRAGLEGMARELWPPLKDLDLAIAVSKRHIESSSATEFGAFRESWRDSTGGRTTEFGRYVTLLARQPDGTWRMDHFFGFEDSTRQAPKALQ